MPVPPDARRAGARLALSLGLLAVGCEPGPSIPDVDLELRITGPAEPVGFGEAFELRVDRIWRTGLQPEPWDDAVLAPLVVTTDRIEVHEDGTRHLEIRWLRAHAFGMPEVALAGLQIEATRTADGSSERAVAPDLRIRVRSGLDGHGEAFELPEPLRAEPTGTAFCWIAGAALVGLAGIAAWVQRRRQRRADATPAADVAAPPTEPASPCAATLALDALGGIDLADPVAAHLLIDGVVRDYLESRFAWPARHRTTSEVLTANAVLDRAAADALTATLDRCDLVKFAAHSPDRGATERTVDHARTFVAATAPQGDDPR